ncbi:MAG: metallophosphoesterase [Oligoflexia bacterium]|nr:metallophosphoesterase [Oligoflexia bacterium]
MRIVHLTDLHVQVRPRVGELVGKRFAATANLYLLGRRRKFDPLVQRAAVQAALAQAPDVVVVTGDLTAQATDAEFKAAHHLLAPILDQVPTVIIPGNHDTYVRAAVRKDRIGQLFGAAMGKHRRLPYLVQHGDVAFLAIETCRAHLLSSGHTPKKQIDQARDLLEQAWPGGSRPFVFLIQHYPLLGRDGLPYGPPARALDNARDVLEFLSKTHEVDAVLHGHEHHGFRTMVPTAAGPIPVFDPGASGYAWLPTQNRTAHFNVYDVDRKGLHATRRYCWNGEAFVDEPGGAYESGR